MMSSPTVMERFAVIGGSRAHRLEEQAQKLRRLLLEEQAEHAKDMKDAERYREHRLRMSSEMGLVPEQIDALYDEMIAERA